MDKDDPARLGSASFFFYGGDLDALHDAATGQGFDAELRKGRPGLEDGLVLTAMVDADRFVDLNDLFAEWAEDFGCEYDGWETELGLN
jgi:hypothetical protein